MSCGTSIGKKQCYHIYIYLQYSKYIYNNEVYKRRP